MSSSQQVPPDCSLALIEVIESVESGAKPYPMFFGRTDCKLSRYPLPGDKLPEMYVDAPPFNIQQQICRRYTGNGTETVPAEVANPNPTDPADYKEGFLDVQIQTCPLPVLERMYIPDMYSIRFFATDNSYLAPVAFVANSGTIYINGSDSPVVNGNNMWVVDKSGPWQPQYNVTPNPDGSIPKSDRDRWASPNNINSNTNNPDCGYTPMSVNPGVENYFSNTQVNGNIHPTLVALNACGVPFFPTFASVAVGSAGIYPDGNGNWVPSLADSNICNPSVDSADSGTSTMAPIAVQFTSGNGDYNTCITSGNGNFYYGHMDCIPSYDKIFNNNEYDRVCWKSGGQRSAGGPCSCFDQLKLAATTTGMQITSNNGNWDIQRFLYCTGTPLTIAGISIELYGNSTPACDPVVQSLCAKTDFVQSNAKYAKACACVLEQKSFEIQFAGLNLPIQCFGTACSTSDPNVYRTTDQAKPCSARLCSQIITISGSDIAAEGYQTMLCDGTEYVVNTNSSTSVGPIPSNVVISPINIKLSPAFYIALAALVVVVILLIAWGIRKWVLNKRLQQQKRQNILTSVEQLLAQKP
jgi:hypothetical protein